jgi:hypothetical protein
MSNKYKPTAVTTGEGVTNTTGLEKVSDAMARSVFDNAYAFLDGRRPDFHGHFLVDDAVHASAMPKFSSMLEDTPFSEHTLLQVSAEEEWRLTDRNRSFHTLKLHERVARAADREILVELVFELPDDEQNKARLAIAQYVGQISTEQAG